MSLDSTFARQIDHKSATLKRLDLQHENCHWLPTLPSCQGNCSGRLMKQQFMWPIYHQGVEKSGYRQHLRVLHQPCEKLHAVDGWMLRNSPCELHHVLHLCESRPQLDSPATRLVLNMGVPVFPEMHLPRDIPLTESPPSES